jgi:hypothetical protein
MARLTPAELGEKYRRALKAVAAARGAERSRFDFTSEVQPGVKIVLAEAGGTPLAFSLWSRPQDISELCSDASVPATAALLAIDEGQARDVRAAGVALDLSQFRRSQSRPDVYYVLLDHSSPHRIHAVLRRLVPGMEPHAAAA